MKEKPSYYAIIPASVRYDDNLRANEKLLYGEITALSNKTGVCYASNNYFAKLYKVTPQAISKWVQNLREREYIEMTYIKEGEQIKGRAIRLRGINKCYYLSTNDLEGYQQKFKENNTSINNIERNKKELFDYDWIEDKEYTDRKE